MKSIYQPFIIEKAKIFIDMLEESQFFEDFEIKDKVFALDYFCDKLTNKFIEGELNEVYDIFTDVEMDKILGEIVTGSILLELQKDGMLDYIENENNEEIFFLTTKGKEVAKKVNSDKKK